MLCKSAGLHVNPKLIGYAFVWEVKQNVVEILTDNIHTLNLFFLNSGFTCEKSRLRSSMDAAVGLCVQILICSLHGSAVYTVLLYQSIMMKLLEYMADC